MEFDLEIDTGELENILKKLPDQMQKKVLRNAVSAGARVIRDKAKELVPYDTKRKSGTHLRDAIGVKRVGRTNDLFDIGVRRTGAKRAYHGHLVELGTKTEYGTVKTRAQPFLRTASDEAFEKAVGRILNNLSNGILRLSKDLARGK